MFFTAYVIFQLPEGIGIGSDRSSGRQALNLSSFRTDGHTASF